MIKRAGFIGFMSPYLLQTGWIQQAKHIAQGHDPTKHVLVAAIDNYIEFRVRIRVR